MKSNNVRELMNLLSDKYFGSELNYGSNKSSKVQIKGIPKNQQNTFSVVSQGLSPKLSPKFNRTSSLSQMKKNETLNYLEESRNILQQTKNILKKPVNSFNRNDRNSLKIRQSSDYEIGYDRKNNNESYQYEYVRKYSQKDLNKNDQNNQVNLNSYVKPVMVGVKNGEKCYGINKNILKNNKEIGQSTNSRLIKQGITEAKGISGKRLFLRQNSSAANKLQSHSTISNSRSTKYIEDAKQPDQKDYYTEHPQLITMTKKQKEQLQFYRKKCAYLEQENLGLKEKVSLYQQQFNEEKQMVNNLNQMISQRELQINQIINTRLSAFQQKEKLLENVNSQNQALKSQLNSVKKLLRQQQAIIIQLYAQSKNKPFVLNEALSHQEDENKCKLPQNGKKTLTSLTSQSSHSSTKKYQHAPYGLTNLDARQSIEQSSYEDQ